MYNSQEVANVIKRLAKSKKIAIGTMLSECNISKNTLSSMQSGGYLPRVETLIKIADYLNCSVDYLLGRTDVPDVNTSKSLIDQEVDAYRADLELEARLASSVSSTPDAKEA